METVYAQAVRVSSETATDICKNEQAEKFIGNVAAKGIGIAVGSYTGSSVAGTAAELAAIAHRKEVAQVTTAAAVNVALAAGSVVFAAGVVVAIPVIIGKAIWDGIFGD